MKVSDAFSRSLTERPPAQANKTRLNPEISKYLKTDLFIISSEFRNPRPLPAAAIHRIVVIPAVRNV